MPEGMTNTQATIRSFAPDDWGALCALYEPAARCELALSGTDPRAFRPMSEEEELDEFQHLNTAMVACLVDRVVGFVAWRDRGEWRWSGYLSWLYVDPAFHRRGIGSRLLANGYEKLVVLEPAQLQVMLQLPLSESPRLCGWMADGARLMALSGNRLAVWDASKGYELSDKVYDPVLRVKNFTLR